jgi:DNA (cytosine-5)-methyltransferase 1
MTVYYNEIDPYAAQWLRNLIAAGHLAKGEVDERSITEIQPDDLLGFNQCHFFAGIGVWGYALRQAGWADDRPVWTGSCPCQPFSAAGKQEGFADERHLWPTWFNLISQCHPAIVLGEQVASALDWLDLVSTDMESAGYAFGAADLCAAGFGGAHIRQRLYFAGAANSQQPRLEGHAGYGHHGGQPRRFNAEQAGSVAASGGAGGLADADHNERRQVNTNTGRRGEGGGAEGLDERSGYGGDERIGLADTGGKRRDRVNARVRKQKAAHAQDDRRGAFDGLGGQLASRVQSKFVGVADAEHHDGRPIQQERRQEGRTADGRDCAGTGGNGNDRPHAPMLGRDAADWLYCRDDKWRPVEPGTFPLADAATSRVGRLRAYGNGLDAETATQFVAAVMDCAP